MSQINRVNRALRGIGWVLAVGLVVSAMPAGAQQTQQTETSLADLLSGTAVPHAVKLKDLTPEWRRLSLSGDTMLGMGGMMQSMMQGLGAMFGGGAAAEAIYTRGAVLKIGDERFLVGYRLPAQGIDFGALMAMGAGAAGGKPAPDAAPKAPPSKPITPDSELSLVLVNVRAIASISDIRPFNLTEAMKSAGPGLMEMIKSTAAKPDAGSAVSHLEQAAAAVLAYTQQHDDRLPPMGDAASLEKAVLPFVKSIEVFKSPATGRAFLPNPNLSGRKLSSLPEPAGVVMLYSAVPEPDGTRVVARADGAVRTVGAEEWQKLAQAQKLPAP
jgi:hypothetical protein